MKISDADRQDAAVIWDYHQMGHDLRRCDAGIGLGSHDLGVATLAADLYHAGLFPVLVFTGANSSTTLGRFPRGEAVHYAEQAMALGVPQQAIIIEPEAANTGQNIGYARRALTDAGITPASVMPTSASPADGAPTTFCRSCSLERLVTSRPHRREMGIS